MSENPVIHLFDLSYRGWTRRFQQKYPTWSKWGAVAVMAYLGLGMLSTLGFTFSFFGPLAGWALLLAELAGLGLILIPASVGGAVYMGLQAIRQGRSLEELLSAGVSAPQVLDGFVLASLRHVARLTLGTWVALLAGSLALLEFGPWAPLIALAWLPSVALLAVTAGYQWGRHAVSDSSDYLRQIVAMGVLMTGLTILTALVPPALSGPVAGGLLLIALGLALWHSRLETIGRLSRPVASVRKCSPRKAAGPLPEGNPLLIRETMRRLSWSWWARHWDGLATVALGFFYCFAVAADPHPTFSPAAPLLVFWAVLVMLAPFRAAFRSLEVFQTDRQAGTLDSLLTTRLTAAEAVEGAARLGWERPLRELVGVGLIFVPVGFLMEFMARGSLAFVPDFTVVVASCALSAAWYLTGLFAASYLGATAGLRASTRQEAWMKLGGWGLKAYFSFWVASMLMMPVAVLTAESHHAFAPSLMALSYGTMFVLAPYILWRWSRGIAYKRLRNSAQEPGFC